MSDEQKPQAITMALVGITEDLAHAGIRKSGHNSQQNYAFRGIEQVYQSLAPLLVKHKVTITPAVEERQQSERSTRNGGSLYSVVLRVRFTLTCGVDGSAVDVVVMGEGMDSADKATNKAMSAAYKYMAFMTFCIPVEGTPDADASVGDRAPARRIEPFRSLEEAESAMRQQKTPASLRAVGERVRSSGFKGADLEAAKECYSQCQEALGIEAEVKA